MQRTRWVSLGMLAAAVICIVGGMATPRTAAAQDTTASAPKPKKVQKGNSSLITQSEVESVANEATNAYEVIEKVRPAMLRRRGGPSGSEAGSQGITVFLDQVRSGDLQSLRSISTSQIKEIRYLNATDATQRWGTGYTDGVIQVISKR
jgi:hypothetical protein